MRKIRIAQIGINRFSHGVDIFETLCALPDEFEIAGWAPVEDECLTCADKLGVFDGYQRLSVEEILADPSIEAVAIETDEIHLTKYASLAAKAGKHIHMEKPGSPDGAAFDRLIDSVKAGGVLLHIGYMYRYNPVIADAVKRAASGGLGEILSVEAQMSRMDGQTVRRWLSAFPGGMTFYLGCHLLDLVLRIQGMPQKIHPLSRPTADGFGPDYGMAVLEYEHGVSYIKAAGTEIGGGSRRQLVISGTAGSIEIRPLEVRVPGEGYLFVTHKCEFFADGRTVRTVSEPFDRYKPMMRAFAAMVRGEAENPYTPEYERTFFHALLACCGAEKYHKEKENSR